MAVVTSSVPLGGEVFDSGGGSAVRARSVDSASEGAPARTGRGLCEGGEAVLAVRGLALAFGSGAAAFCFALAALVVDFAAAVFGFAFVAVADLRCRSCAALPPNRVARVAGRLPRTLSSSRLVAHLRTSLRFTRRASGHSIYRIGETRRTPRRRRIWRTPPMDESGSSA